MLQKLKTYWLLILILLLFCVVSYLFYLDWRDRDLLTFAMLDVGQGDALFIESPTGIQVLIDAGPPKTILNKLPKLMPVFDRSIDLIVITNPDLDHIGGFVDILKQYKVKKLIQPGTTSDSDAFAEIEHLIKEKNIENIIAERGMRIDLGAGAVLDILFPDQDVSLWANNDGSLVSRLVYGETSVMLMGDATSTTEEILLNTISSETLDSDILKVGHHGSHTSSSLDFLNVVTPETAMISLGENNRYGHPHSETLSNLGSIGADILRTDMLGTIILKSDGREHSFSFMK